MTCAVTCAVCGGLGMVLDPQLADATHPAGQPRRCPACYNPATDTALQQTLSEHDGLSSAERKYSLADLTEHKGNRDAIKAARGIIETHGGIAYLWSFPIHGVGKSHIMASVCNSFKLDGKQARYMTMFDLLDHLREGHDEESVNNYHARKKALLEIPLLCIDECERFSGTEFALQAATAIISTRYRYRDEIATLLAGNIPPSKLPPHIMDRLKPCAIEIVDTESRRRK